MYINESLSKQDLVKLLHLAVPTGIPASSFAGNTWSIKHTAFIYIFVWNLWRQNSYGQQTLPDHH